MKLTFIGAVAIFISTSIVNAQQLPLKPGNYVASLQLNQTTQLPVHMRVEKNGKSADLIISNASEQIVLKPTKKIGDTLVLPFPNFDSELRVVVSHKKYANGYWINYNKTGNYRIPFKARLGEIAIEEKASVQLTGRWETYFSPLTNDQESAVGIFEQQDNKITGTVLTETGDYRFLEGTVEGSHFYLSAFDGTHAFLLTGSYDGTNMVGTFFSGKHYQTPFTGKLNPTFELRNSDSLTYLKDQHSRISFTLPNIEGTNYTFPNKQTEGKVVIIQIMGTWCPNCMDETKYYKELYEKYHDQGLEIISIGYEAAPTFETQAEKIKRLKERHNLAFTFLVGGKANKSLASEHFKMLNEVISFPTSIYIGRDGLVKRIHTGFNGPGTGQYYIEYVEKTNALIEALLKQ
jgi:thiol-disulfide isomerase/thioredoxin